LLNVISKRGLLKVGKSHPAAEGALARWYAAARKAKAGSFQQIRAIFPAVDQVGNVLIFDIMGGSYRLIVRVSYPSQKLYVKALLTHGEYDRKEWMKWA
jgi:mRNA interferase HigB